MSWFVFLIGFVLPIFAWAQNYEDTSSSLWLGVMIMGGFVMLAAIGALVALAIFLLRKSREYPRTRTVARPL